MWQRAGRTCTLILTAGLLSMHCASTGVTPSPDTVLPPGEVPMGTIALPPGWDDTIVDRIKAGEPTKKVLAVLDFEGNERLAGRVDLRMSDMLTTALVKAGRFDLVERTRIDRVLDEQSLALTGIMDESTAAAMGKILGAQFVVFGSITSATEDEIDKFGYLLVRIQVGIDVRVVNAEDGSILLSESAVGVSEHKVVKTADGVIVSGAIDYTSAYADAARDAVNRVSARIARLSPLIGFVVANSGDGILIDVGEEQGVSTDDRFVVFRVGDEVIHPATGQRLGWKKIILQEIRITSTERTMSTGQAVMKQTPDEPIPGDLVISR